MAADLGLHVLGFGPPLVQHKPKSPSPSSFSRSLGFQIPRFIYGRIEESFPFLNWMEIKLKFSRGEEELGGGSDYEMLWGGNGSPKKDEEI